MIDAHQHFWTYSKEEFSWIDGSMSAIQRDFLPNDLAQVYQKHKVDGSVLIQVNQNEEENEVFHDYAVNHDFIKGTVGWVDFKSENLSERLAYYQSKPLLKGFRHIVQGESDDFLLDPLFTKGVQQLEKLGYTYDILIFERQLKAALTFIKALPENKLIIDHIAKPDIKNQSIDSWKFYMKTIAQQSNVSVKVSGMVTEADYTGWKPEDFTEYLDHLLESFGPEKLVYGSDWPVCLVAASYEQQLQIVQEYFSKLSHHEQHMIFHQNAVNFYGL
ncbi:amidohydrolase family protein [Jiulongibacter sp. NS-SX5]|uniref:amidohydrolase family protein n=1 Tax=Jiulongibacter sp. NS-SX5 TaxID=3463854 RepID=UPI0040594084